MNMFRIYRQVQRVSLAFLDSVQALLGFLIRTACWIFLVWFAESISCSVHAAGRRYHRVTFVKRHTD